MIADLLKEKILTATKSLPDISITMADIPLSHPENPQFGDFAASIAMRLAKDLKKSPLEIADQLASAIEKGNLIQKIDVVKPGFINFFINPKYYLEELLQITKNNITYLPFHFGPEKKFMIEFAHPNTLKLFHIGHLRNITTGESLARIFEATGNTVIRVNYQGDIGLHIAKTLWKIKKTIEEEGRKEVDSLDLRGKISLIGKAYTAGNTAYESDETSKQEIIDVNKMIYNDDPAIMPLFKETRQWSLDYFQEIYNLVDTKFESLYFESQMAKRGVELCKEALKKGILTESNGAVIFPGEKYGLDTRVFLNSLGLPTYEGKELGLAEREFTDYGKIDKCIHVLGGEQVSFSAVTFKAEELLGIIPPDSQFHLVYGKVDVKGQKMSSRKGNVVEGEWLINEAKKKIVELFEKTDEDTAQKLAVASVKYAFLKVGLQNKIDFDLNEAVTLNGNSAPYLIYTYVRTKSILAKEQPAQLNTIPTSTLEEEELALLRLFHQFPEVVYDAARTYSPHLIATYLFSLAQTFNLFYQKHPILNAEAETKQLRLLLTLGTSTIIQKALTLLGIQTVEKM